MIYMLDTNICIYVIKKKPEAVLKRFQSLMGNDICISSITLAELEYGVKHSANPAKNQQALIRFLLLINVLPFDANAATKYGEIREHLQKKGTPIGALDMLIASHAKAEDLILVTNNLKEFERVPGLKVENWI